MFFLFRTCYGQEDLTFTVNGVSFTMIFVEGGTFIMGCTSGQANCFPEERPAHKVTLSDFYMGELQVTQKLWKAVMGTTVRQQWIRHQMAERERVEIDQQKKNRSPEYFVGSVNIFDEMKFTIEDYAKVLPLNGEGDDYPIYLISYSDCELFCNRLTQLLSDKLPADYKFRMPTEAQWEYAARGGRMSQGYTYSGSDNIDEVAWYNANSEKNTHEVGNKMPNELGIYDMSGNVWEWCRDKYDENYYCRSSAGNPKGPDKGMQYVLRGGSWEQNSWNSRTTARGDDNPTVYTVTYGFRLALEPPPKLIGSGYFGYTGNFTVSRLASGKNLTFKINDAKFEMNFVEGGTFAMGCPSEHHHCDTIEKPAHNVKLANFYMGKLEVTQQLWTAVMKTTLRQQRDLANPNWGIYGEGGQYPIYYVSYDECELFCEKLNQLLYAQLPEGYKFSLPTEAQWEYAACGGKKSQGYTYSGNNKLSKVAWWEGNSGSKIREVGLKSKNELGMYDMSGNVWEWCRDWFGNYDNGNLSTSNPQGQEWGDYRVLRGGAWNIDSWNCRVTNRFFYKPGTRSANLGFRIVLEPPKDMFDLRSLKNTASPRTSSVINRNFKVNNLYFTMVFVEGGTFTMGCTSDPKDCYDNEEPTHSVTLSNFFLGQYQVTQQLWTTVMGTTVQQQRDLGNPEWELNGEGDYYPIYYTSYNECDAFCEKLNQLLYAQLPEGYKFRLPTEAQWEYAARGGRMSQGYLYSGDNNIRRVAWYDENSNIQTHKVGIKKKNELGIYDMSGNLWEWCYDWFDGDYYIYSPSVNPAGPDYGYYRVQRGGSWRSLAQGCRVSCRNKRPPDERAANYGFRLALVKDD